MTKWIAVTGVVGILIGFGVGQGTAKGGSETSPVAEATPKTPSECIEALDLGGEVMVINGNAFGAAAEYLPLIRRAAEAGTSFDADALSAVTAEMERINTEIQGFTADLETITPRLGEAVSICRSAA